MAIQAPVMSSSLGVNEAEMWLPLEAGRCRQEADWAKGPAIQLKNSLLYLSDQLRENNIHSGKEVQ